MKAKLLSLLSRLGLIALGVIISLALLEAGFRILYPNPSPRLVNQGLQFNPLYELSFIPNAEGWNTSLRGEYSTYVKFNSRGLRGPEVDYRKPENTFRILVLGDSFTAALQVPEAETFPRLLENQLRQRFPQTNIEVINAGVVGYGTDNALAYFVNEGYKYQPDLVLLAFFTGNDLTDNIWYPLYRLEDGALLPVEPERPAERAAAWAQEGGLFWRVRTYLYTHSRLYSVSIELLTLSAVQNLPGLAQLLTSLGLVEITQPLVNQGNFYVFRYLPPEAWNATEALLLELKRQVAAHHSQMVVVILPDETEVSEQRRREIVSAYAHLVEGKITPGPPPAEQLAEILQQRHIPHLSLLPTLKNRQQNNEPLYYRYDGHWTPAGHRLAGQAIFNFLMSQQVDINNFPQK